MQCRRTMVGALLLVLILSSAALVSAQNDQGSISYGDTVNGSLTTASGDEWTFQGAANDSVTIQLDSEAFDPVVDLVGTDNTILASDDDSGGNFNSLISSFALPSAGTYSIRVHGYLGTARGAYTLSLSATQSSSGAGTGGRFSGGEMRYGQTVNEDLNSSVGDRWTFEGTNGDLISITLNSTDFDPFLELIGIDGEVLTSDDDSGNGLNARISRFALPSTGTYSIVARGFSDTERGAYTLSLTLMDNFVTGEISYNEVMSGNLRDGVGEFWAFEAEEGDTVTISISSDEFDTYVELLSPTGAQLANNDDISADNRNSRLDRVQLPVDGTYLIVVHGYLDTARGEYTLSITSPNATVSSTNELVIVGAILYGDTVSGNLATSGGDAWTFDANAGDVVTVSLTSQVFDTYAVLLGADGTELISDDNGGDSLNALISEFVIPSNGTYTVVARGVLSSDRGTYTLSLQSGDASEAVNGNSPISVGTISRGVAVSGNVTTDSGDAWTFSGKAGESITIAANSDEFNTYLELFDSGGELVIFNDDSGPRLNALIEGIVLPNDGEFTIVVRSFLANGRGAYSLAMQSDSPSIDVVSASDEAMRATLITDSNALPNAVIISSIEVTNLQAGSVAYCVVVSLETDVFTIVSANSVLIGNVSGDETDIAQFEVFLANADSGLIDASIEWYDTQDCNGDVHRLTTNRQFGVVSETWQIGVDVYPSCTVDGEVIISVISEDGEAVTQPIVLTAAPYSIVFDLAAQSGNYYAHAQLFCITPSGERIPHVYSRLLEIDHAGQLFNVGIIDTPLDSDLPPAN